MSSSFKAACVQISSQLDMDANLEAASALVRDAADNGAQMVLLPENVSLMGTNREQALAMAMPEARHKALPVFTELAREKGVWLMVGSLSVRLDEAGGGEDMLANRSLLISDQGEVMVRYDKIHMFDVNIEGGESHRESETYRPGAQAVVAATPWGGLGMTICYDLRFPYLYRSLAQAGAHFMSVPSAFTRVSGRAHWHVLLRARAVETGCYIFAPAQCGDHANDRQTYGHSLIIDPWGKILAEAGESPCVIAADIDPSRVAAVRAMIPSLKHDRKFTPLA
ncbi:MAG: carbon-nitrogen hydrolase family protein [Alphaproteobacteria bacterium]|jgi:predicted amidohydrolase|nr:carbon-nitrogen hydrolase family protein [Alphaproteobacteria bacterium]|tara:strand:+ start:362 stop:1204 length:843 start_codon:yes stop_codon:yes gene_type:complete